MDRILKIGLAVWNGTKTRGFRLHFTFLFSFKVRLDCNSRVEISRTSMEISLNHIDFTDFFRMLVVAKLRFIFFSECFFTNFENHHKQSRFFWTQSYRSKDVNILDFTNFQIQVHDRKCLRGHVIYSF